ncbi:MAG: RluA family pseudouridine synthase [Myxococcales bacterium]|nr:MAG: RluA family pseudouridine synthase [Myxococcales bacterium]
MSAPLFRWVVAAPLELSRLLTEQGLGSALKEGRVFVDGKRASAEQALPRGAEVQVFAPRPRASIQILSEGDGVFAVHKPASLPTEPDKSGADCVLSQLARELRVEPQGLFAVSRLDVGVSGVLLVTLGAGSRERVLAERSAGRLRRRYVALGNGVPSPAEGRWAEALGNAGRGRRGVEGKDAQRAESEYRVVATARPVTVGGPRSALLALTPLTGRTHQLRVHAAAHGAPLLGDRKYGGPPRMTSPDGAVQTFAQILLHAAWVEWGEPPRRLRAASEPVAELCDAWVALGGDIADIQRALD